MAITNVGPVVFFPLPCFIVICNFCIALEEDLLSVCMSDRLKLESESTWTVILRFNPTPVLHPRLVPNSMVANGQQARE